MSNVRYKTACAWSSMPKFQNPTLKSQMMTLKPHLMFQNQPLMGWNITLRFQKWYFESSEPYSEISESYFEISEPMLQVLMTMSHHPLLWMWGGVMVNYHLARASRWFPRLAFAAIFTKTAPGAYETECKLSHVVQVIVLHLQWCSSHLKLRFRLHFKFQNHISFVPSCVNV